MAIPGPQTGGTYHIFLAYFLGYFSGDIPPNFYGSKYGTLKRTSMYWILEFPLRFEQVGP
jgi:hypothetical protein